MDGTMKCETCQHTIKKSVNFCENCGAPTIGVNTDVDSVTQGNDRRQKLIFRGLIVLCSYEMYNFLLNKISTATDSFTLYEVLGPISMMFGILAAGAALFIALGLDMGKRKIYAIVLASIYAFINLFWIIELRFL